MSRSALLLAGVLLALSSGAASGQDSAPSSAWSPCRTTVDAACSPKAARAEPLGDRKVRIDGRLDEAVWAATEFDSSFARREPIEGTGSGRRTEVAFVSGPDALYVGARMHSQGSSTIQAPLTRRDDGANAERLVVFLDPYSAGRSAVAFSVTAAGVRLDWTIPDDSEFGWDTSFDPVWLAEVAIDSGGWSAEMKIPYSQMRFEGAAEQTWGVNVRRHIPSSREDILWAAVPKDAAGWVSWFGELHGVRPTSASRPLEVLPYLTTSGTLTSAELIDPEDPFRRRAAGDWRAGVDAKLGIGSSLTLDVTINPDFGQVESDPAEVNLTAFPTFFSERRPFFLEGNQLLEGDGPGYYYSRRIGAEPTASADGAFAENPQSTTVLGAAKLTGRTERGLSLGAQLAVTADEHATVQEAVDSPHERRRVEPVASYGVVRLEQEIDEAGTKVGAILTTVHRDLPEGDPLAGLLPAQAYTGGVDWDLSLWGGDYELTGYAGFSTVRGDPEAITRLQRSNVHYFQRPDADHLALDTTRTSLAGYTAELDFERTGGRWLWSTRLAIESPGFELNEAGRQGRADDIDLAGFVEYRETRPRGLFHEYAATLVSRNVWNFGGKRKRTSVHPYLEATFANFWSGEIGLDLFASATDDNATRGGPATQSPYTWTLGGEVATDSRRNTRASLGASFRRDDFGGRDLRITPRVELQAGTKWSLSVSPRYRDQIVSRQYVTARPDGPPATFGSRYIFARAERSELSLEARLDLILTPDFSLEAYAEPFISKVSFSNFGELIEAGSGALRRYGEGGTTIRETNGRAPHEVTVTDGATEFSFLRGDRQIASLRTNLVGRWEWRPGSTMFVVFQFDRGESDFRTSPGNAGLEDLWRAFGTPGSATVAVKVSYWLPI